LNLRLPGMTQEMLLLLACCRASISKEDSEKIRTLGHGPIDWNTFINLADRHRVTPLVRRSLNRYSTERIPDYVVDSLSARVEKNTQRALTMTSEFVRVFKFLAQRSIPVIPLKGPILALQLYDDVGLRHVGDLDLLVTRQNVEETDQVLLRKGYKRIKPDFALPSAQKAAFLNLGDHFTYFHDSRQIKIELHWRWHSNPYLLPLDMERARKRGQTVIVADTEVKTVGIDDTILYLCTHGATHIWLRLFWLCDLVQILHKNSTIDWTALMSRAIELGVQRPLIQGLTLSNLLLGSPLPEPVRAHAESDPLMPRIIKAGLSGVLMRLPDPGTRTMRVLVKEKLNEINLRRELRYKLHCLTTGLTSPNDWKILRLPDVLFPLYFVLRPFLWFWRWFLIRKLHRLHR
jgi:hypothetical protein